VLLKLQLLAEPGLTSSENLVCSFYEGNQPS
jgi:hypothetical protein